MTGSRVIRISNVKYEEIDKILNNFDGKYKSFNFSKIESFTPYELGTTENIINSDFYLRLRSTNDFNNIYVDYHPIYIKEGRSPKDSNEIILPYSLKTGFENKTIGKIDTYKIGDIIKLNIVDFYNIENTPSGEKEFKAKYKIKTDKNKSFSKNSLQYKEYIIVGFYEENVKKNNEKYFNELNYSLPDYNGIMDLFTFSSDKDFDADDRIQLNIFLKFNAYSSNKLQNKISKLYELIDRYDESDINHKTLNDTINVDYSSKFEYNLTWNDPHIPKIIKIFYKLYESL